MAEVLLLMDDYDRSNLLFKGRKSKTGRERKEEEIRERRRKERVKVKPQQKTIRYRNGLTCKVIPVELQYSMRGNRVLMSATGSILGLQ